MMFFASLYFLQGAALAYIVNFQKPYLLVQGIDKVEIGIFTSLLLIPFIAKVFLGYVSDRWPWPGSGGRKPYMLVGLTLFAVSYLIVSQIPPGQNFVYFAAFSFIASLGLAWFDTCADGWAIDVSGPKEEGRIQAAMVAGKSAGLILMSMVFGFVGLRFGFNAIFQCLVIFAVVVGWMVLRNPYVPIVKSELKQKPSWQVWRQSNFVLFALFGIIYSVASFGTDGLLTLHRTESHSADLIAVGGFGALRGIGALLGAVAYAIVYPRWGVGRAQRTALILLSAGCLLPILNLPWMIPAVLWGIFWAFQETAYVTLAMRYSRGGLAATFFAIFMIFSNLGTSMGEALAAPLVGQIGYAGVFILFAGVAAFCLIFVRRIVPEKA